MTQAEKLKKQVAEQKTQAPAQKKEQATIYTLLEKMKPQIAKALPKHFSEERMVRLLMTAVRNNPQLQQANAMSLLSASMQAAQMGLEPNTTLGHCYIIPYKGKQGMMAEFQLGYKGIIQLSYNTGEYKAIYAHEVYANDEFSFSYGLNKDLHHVPADIPEGQPTHYYAVYHLKNGGFDFKVMSAEAIRFHAQKYSKSFSYSSSPWQKDFNSMALKTVLLGALKYAPKATEVAKAIEADSTTKLDIAEDMTTVIDAEFSDVDIVSESPEDYAYQLNQEQEPVVEISE